jgi:enoyl-CoA hydratase
MNDHGSDAMPDDALDFGFEHLSIAIDDAVALITIDRPNALNALSGEVLLELASACEVVSGDEQVRALVITGAGRAFVAGADVAELADLADHFAGREASLSGQDVMQAIANLPFATIAAINGFALGGGLELALACDFRVAAPNAKLGLPEVGLGLIPGYGGTQRLPRLIGASRALDLILTGRHVGAAEALALGLVNRVADDVVAEAVALARLTTRAAPVAIGLAKEAVARGATVHVSQALEIEADLFGMAIATADAREGMAAFLAKRKPEFSGR